MVSDLLGLSGQRILTAIPAGEQDPIELAALGDGRLKVSKEALQAALKGKVQPAHRLLLGLYLEQVKLIDRQIAVLEGEISAAMRPHAAAVERLAEIPGLGMDSAQQASWVGSVPGERKVRVSRTVTLRRKGIARCHDC